jgi:hypothetical protein
MHWNEPNRVNRGGLLAVDDWNRAKRPDRVPPSGYGAYNAKASIAPQYGHD